MQLNSVLFLRGQIRNVSKTISVFAPSALVGIYGNWALTDVADRGVVISLPT
jgi:hypothetical protein